MLHAYLEATSAACILAHRLTSESKCKVDDSSDCCHKLPLATLIAGSTDWRSVIARGMVWPGSNVAVMAVMAAIGCHGCHGQAVMWLSCRSQANCWMQGIGKWELTRTHVNLANIWSSCFIPKCCKKLSPHAGRDNQPSPEVLEELYKTTSKAIYKVISRSS